MNPFLERMYTGLVANKIVTGVLTVATAGTPEPFPKIGEVIMVFLSVPVANTFITVTIGDANVSNATGRGLVLYKGQSWTQIPINALHKLYADVGTDGDEVGFMALLR